MKNKTLEIPETRKSRINDALQNSLDGENINEGERESEIPPREII